MTQNIQWPLYSTPLNIMTILVTEEVQMKKTCLFSPLLLIILILITGLMVVNVFADSAPSRIIHVVYDDSQSMILIRERPDGPYVPENDSWCQAKYAMEVFAAMLEENDTMKIYVMSDFEKDMSAGPKLVLQGSTDAASNVEAVHQMITRSGDTPFNSVRKAYADLLNEVTDEKWLVVLTDGEFQGVDDVDDFFREKDDSIRVLFLGMGPEAEAIKSDAGRNLFFEKAETTDQILSKITGMCTRIFNSDKLDVDLATNKITFDVPMKQLIVFAQGAEVVFNGITTPAENTLVSDSTVGVRYSTKASTNIPDGKIAYNLVGLLASFDQSISSGEYILDIKGAETIEVYYKPDVEIRAYLVNLSGDEVADLHQIEAGDYTIQFGFVKAGSEDRLPRSDLLGDVDFSALIQQGDEETGTLYRDGERIQIAEGRLTIDATARYLDYHTVSTHLEYGVFTNKPLSFDVQSSPTFYATKEGLTNSDEPIVVRADWAGSPFPADLWESMGLPEITMQKGDKRFGDFRLEKTDTPGIYHLYPSLAKETLTGNTLKNAEFSVSYSRRMEDGSLWSGIGQGELRISDERSWFARNRDTFIRILVFGLLGLLILGYIPPFKRYIPKRVKRRPAITSTPRTPGLTAGVARGSVTKSFISTIFPYKAQTATIRYTPPGVSGAPRLRVKAANKSSMHHSNVKQFAGRQDITFNGMSVEEGQTKQRIGSNTNITYSTESYNYECHLNQ